MNNRIPVFGTDSREIYISEQKQGCGIFINCDSLNRFFQLNSTGRTGLWQ